MRKSPQNITVTLGGKTVTVPSLSIKEINDSFAKAVNAVNAASNGKS